MPRRASSSIHPGLIGLAVLGVILAIIAGKFLVGGKSSTFGSLPQFDVAQFLENANSMRGNEYIVEGQVGEKLRWTAASGQFVSVRVDKPGGEEIIGIEIPPEFDTLNIETRQRYAFRVRVREGGIPVATGINRL